MPDNGYNPIEIPSQAIELRITLNPQTGQVQVSGPIANALLCYGLLISAQQVISDFAKSNQSSIVVPSLQIPNTAT